MNFRSCASDIFVLETRKTPVNMIFSESLVGLHSYLKCPFCGYLSRSFGKKHNLFYFRERLTRQLYYLQLKDNLLYYKHQYSDDKCFLLAAYALQADIGSYNPQLQSHYFDPREYFPAWVGDTVVKHIFKYVS